MTEIETDGFLSDEAIHGRTIYRERFAEWFDVAEKLNRLAIGSLSQAHLSDIDSAQQVVYLLTIRVIEAYESIVILMERGLLSSSKLIVRPMLGQPGLYSAAVVRTEMGGAFAEIKPPGDKHEAPAFEFVEL